MDKIFPAQIGYIPWGICTRADFTRFSLAGLEAWNHIVRGWKKVPSPSEADMERGFRGEVK
jgi:hypothetical protein